MNQPVQAVLQRLMDDAAASAAHLGALTSVSTPSTPFP